MEDIKNAYIAFQPIWDLKRHLIIGYEAFLRYPQSQDAQDVLRNAVEANSIDKLDAAVHRLAIASLPSRFNLSLFLNCHPNSIKTFFEEEHHFNAFKGKIILEITEVERIKEEDLLAFSTEAKKRGLDIALDDFGAGYNNISVLHIIKPAYIKLDKSIIQQHDSRLMKNYLYLIQEWAEENNVLVIAEGIETKKDYEYCLARNIYFGQGFLLGRPQKPKQIEQLSIDAYKAL